MNWLTGRFGPPIAALRGVVGNRQLRRAQLAFLLFNAAEAATWVAILVYAYDRGGTSTTGVVGLLLLVPATVVAPFAAALGDRYRRERVVRIGYAMQAVTVAATAAAMLAEAPAWSVFALATLVMATLTTGRPGHHSLLPSLADTPSELTAGNSVSSLAEAVGGSLGTLLVAAVLATGGPGAVYAAMAAGLAAATWLAWGVRSSHAPPAVARLRPWAFGLEALEGLRAVARTPGPRLLVSLAGVVTVTWGLFDVLIVTLAIERLGIGEGGVGALYTAMGVGAFVGAGASVALVGRRSILAALLAATVLYGASIAATGAVEQAAAAAVACLLAGAGLTLLDVAGRTLLQRVVDDTVLTRVFGAIESLWMAGVGVGSALSAVLAGAFGLTTAFVVAGSALPVATLVALGGLRRLDREAVVPERQLSLLRAIPMFAPLPRLDLERVATQLSRFVIPRDNVVVRQGDLGDRFYVIDAGEFEVAVDGAVVRTLGPGDHFGEIALLHDVPRTATVRSVTDGAVWALDQEEFLATLTGMPQAESAAHAVSAERLRVSDDDAA